MMGLSIVHYKENGNQRWGVLKGDIVLPVEGDYETLASFLREGIPAAKKAFAENKNGTKYSELDLLSPVTSPAQVVCQGANYGAHREEAGLKAARPPFNLTFTKAPSSISGANDDILSPEHIKLLDYEIEVGLVIGKDITEPVQVSADNLHEFVAGFVIANDISARDTQFTEGQWFKGKSYRTFCPVGPILYLIDKEEASYIHELELTLSVNDSVRQSARTEQLLYKPEETLSGLSELMSFYQGDLLLTGTPGGVALKLSQEDSDLLTNPFAPLNDKISRLNTSQQNNSKYLKDGDLIKSEIKSSDGQIDLGIQKNRVVFLSK